MTRSTRPLGPVPAAPGAPRPGRRRGWAALAAGLVLAGCTTPQSGGPPASTSAAPAASADTTPTGGSGSAPSTGSSPTATAAQGSPGHHPTPSAQGTECVERTVAAMTPQQRLGQLFMVGLYPSPGPSGVADALTRHRVGAVIYLGGWSGAARIAETSAQLQRTAAGPVELLVAADQEGGAVQQLSGPGFTRQPRALDQGRERPAALTDRAMLIGRELGAAGVNVDLAPVADTVPPGQEARNQPIGRWGRHYGTQPELVATAVPAVVAGLQSQQVVATLKHFPGLGRVTGNTDLTATGISDDVATVEDPHLEPFRAGIAAGVGMVMVSSARYPRLDPRNQAVFSRAVVTDLLRGRLGFTGVVITDDVGSAKAVAAVPVGERAVRFLAAGGDIVLTAQAGQVPTMLSAVRGRADADADFAAAVEAATRRVVSLKARFGLVRCG